MKIPNINQLLFDAFHPCVGGSDTDGNPTRTTSNLGAVANSRGVATEIWKMSHQSTQKLRENFQHALDQRNGIVENARKFNRNMSEYDLQHHEKVVTACKRALDDRLSLLQFLDDLSKSIDEGV